MSSTLIKSQQHDPDLLALYVASAGKLVDAAEIAYQVWDDTTTPTKLLPSGAGTWQAITSSFRTGCYGVYVSGSPWTPSAVYKKARVLWRYKLAATDTTYTTRTVYFEVVESTVARSASRGMTRIQDVRDLAWVPAGYTDMQIHQAIRYWQRIVERYCRQRFVPVYASRRFPRTTRDALHLPEVLQGLLTVYDHDLESNVDLTDVENVCTTDEIDMGNPKLVVKSQQTLSIFEVSVVRLNGFRANRGYTVTGIWGFYDAQTYEPPEAIFGAFMQLLRLAIDPTADAPTMGVKRSETTDGHSVAYGPGSRPLPGTFLSLLKDPAIRDVLNLYSGPSGMALSAPLDDTEA